MFDYKLREIACASEIGNQAAAREFEIDESMPFCTNFLCF